MHLFVLSPSFPVGAPAPPWVGPVQQQPAFCPVRGSWRPVLPVSTKTGRKPVGVWLQVGSSAQMFTVIFFKNKSKKMNKIGLHCFSIHYMVYWLRLHPGVRHSGLLCRSPPEHTGESVEEYVHSYNRECPKDRQHSRADQDQTDPELWNTAMEVQGEFEEELEPSHLRAPQKYQIIRLSWLKWTFHLQFNFKMVLFFPFFLSISTVCIRWRKYIFQCCFYVLSVLSFLIKI